MNGDRMSTQGRTPTAAVKGLLVALVASGAFLASTPVVTDAPAAVTSKKTKKSVGYGGDGRKL
jgi:hypothetical protein